MWNCGIPNEFEEKKNQAMTARTVDRTVRIEVFVNLKKIGVFG